PAEREERKPAEDREQHESEQNPEQKRHRADASNGVSGYTERRVAGWSSQVARRAHNPEVAGSNPAPAIEARFGGPFSFGRGLKPRARCEMTADLIGVRCHETTDTPVSILSNPKEGR